MPEWEKRKVGKVNRQYLHGVQSRYWIALLNASLPYWHKEANIIEVRNRVQASLFRDDIFPLERPEVVLRAMVQEIFKHTSVEDIVKFTGMSMQGLETLAEFAKVDIQVLKAKAPNSRRARYVKYLTARGYTVIPPKMER